MWFYPREHVIKNTTIPSKPRMLNGRTVRLLPLIPDLQSKKRGGHFPRSIVVVSGNFPPAQALILFKNSKPHRKFSWNLFGVFPQNNYYNLNVYRIITAFVSAHSRIIISPIFLVSSSVCVAFLLCLFCISFISSGILL